MILQECVLLSQPPFTTENQPLKRTINISLVFVFIWAEGLLF